MAAWIKVSLGMELGFGPGDLVLDGDSAPLPKKKAEPHSPFSAHYYSGQTAECIKMPLGMEVGLGPGDTVLDGDPARPHPTPKKGHSPHFSAHVYCGQPVAHLRNRFQ